MANNNYNLLKNFSKSLGVNLFGVADVSLIKKEFMLSAEAKKRVQRAVCLGIGLSAGVLGEVAGEPNKLYFHHYRAVNNFLDQAALRLADFIQARGFFALPIPASQIIDWEKQGAHLSHKKIGVLAGLGWIGRNNLLVNKKSGSAFRLVSVLTDMPLKADKPGKDSCGSCRACVVACPAQAIVDKPEDFQHLRCFEKLKDFQKQHLVDQYICGVCVKACRGKSSLSS